jgi:hypothetical protein
MFATTKTRRRLEASVADNRFTWEDYMSRFNPDPLKNAQVTAEHDNDLEPTRREAASPPGEIGMPQQWCQSLSELFGVYDEVALPMLTPKQRAAQLAARRELWTYCDALHDAVKTFDAHCEKAENSSVYGLTDLMSGLVSEAETASKDDG